MVQVVKSAIVVQSPDDMLKLVNDVVSYPEFLKWCVSGVVNHAEFNTYQATLNMSVKGVSVSFTTENKCESNDEGLLLYLKLIKGPFKKMQGCWSFKSLGDVGCKVSLILDYEIKSALVNQLFSKSFELIAERMVADFVKRAGVVYD